MTRTAYVGAFARAVRPPVRNKVRAVRIANDIQASVQAALSKIVAVSMLPDAVSLLKEDHRRLESLFERYERAVTDAQRIRFAREICLVMTVHLRLEEELFHPHFHALVDDRLIEDACVRGDSIKLLIADITTGTARQMFWKAKVRVLGEEIHQYIHAAERWDGLFAKARATGVDMEVLGHKLAARRSALLKQFKRNGLHLPVLRAIRLSPSTAEQILVAHG